MKEEEKQKFTAETPSERDVSSNRTLLAENFANSNNLEFEAKPRSDLVAKYSLFKDKLNPTCNVIYHPCGGSDVSPSDVFLNSRVIYADIDERAVRGLKKAGFEAHLVSALEYNPGNVDILIMLNPEIKPDIPSKYIVENGFVLTNDYHGTASSLHQNNIFQLRAIIRNSKDGELIFDTEELENCWKEIDTDEEFQKSPANYLMAARAVEVVTGRRENVLNEYKKIIDMAKKQEIERQLQEDPEHKDSINIDEVSSLIFEYEGRNFVLPTRLPRKKGNVDDTFIFQKMKKAYQKTNLD